MNKDNQELRALLAELHTKLSQAGSVDADSRSLLTTLSSDIEKALQRDGGAESPESKLNELAVKFENDHPALAEAVRDVLDYLGKAGI